MKTIFTLVEGPQLTFPSTNLIIILGMMQVGKKIPFDDPTVMNGVRAVYILSNVLIVTIFYYIQMKINANKGLFFQTHPVYKS